MKNLKRKAESRKTSKIIGKYKLTADVKVTDSVLGNKVWSKGSVVQVVKTTPKKVTYKGKYPDGHEFTETMPRSWFRRWFEPEKKHKK